MNEQGLIQTMILNLCGLTEHYEIGEYPTGAAVKFEDDEEVNGIYANVVFAKQGKDAIYSAAMYLYDCYKDDSMCELYVQFGDTLYRVGTCAQGSIAFQKITDADSLSIKEVK